MSRYERYLEFLGWTEEDLARFYGYKNIRSFENSSANERRKDEFVQLFETVIDRIVYQLDEAMNDIDNRMERLKGDVYVTPSFYKEKNNE